MLKRILTIGLLLPLLAGLAPGAGQAADTPYKEYQRTSGRRLLFELIFDKEMVGYERRAGDVTDRFLFPRSDLQISRDAVMVDRVRFYDNGAIVIKDDYYNLNDVTDLRVSVENGLTVVGFYERQESNRITERIRRGNLIVPEERIIIEEDDFVRGLILTATGDIEVYGEVNKDVVSLFGDVFIGPTAVVRGDVVALAGDVDVAREATVYGEIHSAVDKRRRHRFRRRLTELDLERDGTCYNRVDGLTLHGVLRYEDADSLLPIVWAGGGYAFESKKWRYELGIEQTVLRDPVIALGAEAYRRLASDDEWLITKAENNIFTLLVTEDWLDYYEAEGGFAYLKAVPLKDLEFQFGYRFEETNWLDAERDLWSLFGGSKKFPPNFATVDSATRAAGIQQIDTSANGTLEAAVAFDDRDLDDPYDYPGTVARATAEWSRTSFDSDFDYSRYRIWAARYQPLNRRTTLIARGAYGFSDGDLPMHKRFYLGGLGTLHGYRHKEYNGDEFWMGELEYRADFPRTGFAASIFWNMGQIWEDRDNETSAEYKNSLGISVYISDDVKVMLAKRLDGSNDVNPVFYARFVHNL